MSGGAMRRLLLLSVWFVLVACGGQTSSEDDVIADTGGYSIPDAPTIEVYVPSDSEPQMDVAADASPDTTWPDIDSNTPPKFGPLNPVTLEMGSSTELDVNPFIEDFHDPDEDLTLSWSSLHVAIEDSGDHILYIVAPVDWHGPESIEITVTDSEGSTAMSVLQVIVEDVAAPDPDPDPDPDPEDCDTLFTYDAESSVEMVQLAGTFNNWGQSPDAPDDLVDDDDDGVWELALPLAQGQYKYKFIVDDTWTHDPGNLEKEDDGYGGFNSLRAVPQCPANP